MKNIEQKIIRFYADKPEHMKAFEILGKVSADKASSIQEFVIAAINHYGDMKANEDAQAETEENMQQTLTDKTADRNKEFEEGAFIEKVAGAVEAVMEEKLPLMLTSYLQMAVAEQIEEALQAANGFNVTTGSAEGVPVAKSTVTTANGTVIKDNAETEITVEKDVVANDMLDLDSFFS